VTDIINTPGRIWEIEFRSFTGDRACGVCLVWVSVTLINGSCALVCGYRETDRTGGREGQKKGEKLELGDILLLLIFLLYR